MQIFQNEISDGLSDAIASENTVMETLSLSCNDATAIDQSVFTVPAELGSDVMRFHAILVTTNWNRNDDVFTPAETWLARATPVGKPVNLDHEGREIDWRTGKPSKVNKIVGCMVDVMPVDEQYQPLFGDDIPDKYHLLVASNIWEYLWPSAAKRVKTGIDNGSLYVSMECKFDSFGYAIRETVGGEILLLPRNEETAWLTKHLRKFKGSGKAVINDKEVFVGRWLRQITFVGMGIVPSPGNPESIIFDDYVSTALSGAVDKNNEKSSKSVDLGVLLNSKKDNTIWLI